MRNNKKRIIALLSFIIISFTDCASIYAVEIEDTIKSESQSFEFVHDGDLIFQTSKTAQSKAIQLATKSKYSHVGLIYRINGIPFVYEAVQPVKFTELAEWINRGELAHYVVKRLNGADTLLTSEIIEKMKQVGGKYNGLNYDYFFEWSDDKMYCSELVWKIFKESCGIEIGDLQLLRDFDLSSDVVKKVLSERFGQNIPLDEKVISPAQMFNSDKLITIFEN